MKSILIILALFMLAVQGEAQVAQSRESGVCYPRIGKGQAEWFTNQKPKTLYLSGDFVTEGGITKPYRPAFRGSPKRLLQLWDEWRDSCYADSTLWQGVVRSYEGGIMMTQGKGPSVTHRDPNDLPAFMEFLRRRR